MNCFCKSKIRFLVKLKARNSFEEKCKISGTTRLPGSSVRRTRTPQDRIRRSAPLRFTRKVESANFCARSHEALDQRAALLARQARDRLTGRRNPQVRSRHWLRRDPAASCLRAERIAPHPTHAPGRIVGVGRDAPEPDGFVDTVPESIHIRTWRWPGCCRDENDSQHRGP